MRARSSELFSTSSFQQSSLAAWRMILGLLPSHTLLTWLAILLPLIASEPIVAAQPNAPQPIASPQADDTAPKAAQATSLIQSIGIQGYWKLGHSCIVTLNVSDAQREKVKAAEVTTLDGDGVEVVYRQPYDGSSATIDVPVRIGRRLSVLSASLIGSDKQTIATEDKTFSEQDGLSATQPMVVCLGSSLGLNELVRVSADESERNLSLIEIKQASELPSSWIAYQPCSLVVISTADPILLQQISPAQWQALEQWIRRGGGCIVSLSVPAEGLRSIEGLKKLIPGEIAGDSQIESPAALESLIQNNEQQIQPFPAVRLENQDAQVQLNLRDKLTKQIPWWVRTSKGFGTIQVVASDLNHPSFANWKQRKLLWERLVAPYIDKGSLENSQSEIASSTSYLGYSDIIGQLRATLDQFVQVDSLGFSHISAILIGILILIGPLDYLISVKWLRKPHLSWPIAGVVLVACSAALAWYYQRMRPDLVITNSAQIVDIDTSSGQIDGHIWAHVYSAYARQVDVQFLKADGSDVGAIDWQGLPGKGLGGLQSQLTMERGMPPYAVDYAKNGTAQVSSVGIAAAGTKSLHGVFSDKIELAGQFDLQELESVDQLVGQISNPLDVDLRDVSLIYHRWFYPLKSRMPVGDRMQISATNIPKDLVRRLNRQQEIEGKTTSARWNPSDRTNLDRLMEILMFHNAATGRNYTSLTHNYQNLIDHSNLTESNYAILVGRVDKAPTRTKVSMVNSSDSPEIITGIDSTWYRILIPVEKSRKSKPSR